MYILGMATEIIVLDDFVTWYEALILEEQESVRRVVTLLEDHGVALDYPYSSSVNGSRVGGMRELRTTHAGRKLRVLYAFDPKRQAVLLLGGDKTGKGNRWLESVLPKAEKLFQKYLRGE
jgi:hypothetical protein